MEPVKLSESKIFDRRCQNVILYLYQNLIFPIEINQSRQFQKN